MTARQFARYALAASAWTFAASLLVQVFLAGLGVFAGPVWWPRHVLFVHHFQWLALALPAFAIMARPGRAQWALIAVIFVLISLQYTTAEFRLDARHREWAAFHPVNAFLLLFVTIELARRAWRERRIAAI